MKNLSESLEDYLETILFLEKEQKVARVKEIADKLGVLSGSVTGALRSLAEKGLINYKPYSFITLTKKGRAIAEEITRRHKAIYGFLNGILMLPEEISEKNACRMEHAMEEEAINRLVDFIDFIRRCPRTGTEWVERFNRFRETDYLDEGRCRPCIDSCLKKLT